ncbi:transcriptional regulator [Thermus scotoductus]|uniref:Transcriptional regulator n=1 Tax=Thermus scotoductus TaxID=37636 RepID=A0A430UZ11_THESC|nr:metalloregulator ArsR/SmtB family transcription factor [Thermus scotoductus]RTH98491.1 transcriptional regulator [Thermus scotoductus]RTI14797.1 transcriptional regulator [Thermus scotoductus]
MERHEVPRESRLLAEDLEHVLRIFSALAEATRLRIALGLLEGEESVGRLAQRLQLPQSTTSRHLAVLRGAGVVAARRQGIQVFYRLKSHVADLLIQAFAHAEHQRLGLPDHGA